MNMEIVKQLIKEYVMVNAVDEAYLREQYMQPSDKGEPPVWTNGHLAEVYNDFFMIPREVILNL